METIKRNIDEAYYNTDTYFLSEEGVNEEELLKYLRENRFTHQKGYMIQFNRDDQPALKRKNDGSIIEILQRLKHIQTEIHGLKYHTVGELEKKKKELIGELHSKYNKDICHNCIKRGKIILTTWGVLCEDCNSGMRNGWAL